VSCKALTTLAENKTPDFTSRNEHLAYRFSIEILRDHFITAGTFAAAPGEFGEQGFVDLIGSLGKYSMLATSLNAFSRPAGRRGAVPGYARLRQGLDAVASGRRSATAREGRRS
jgi:hypothetical protein